MRAWAEAFLDDRLSPPDLYREFERIHPFVDGNGRVGDLLWKIATHRKTDAWPEQLPSEAFDPHADLPRELRPD